MFERNKIDNVPETMGVPVEIAFTNGTVAKGKLSTPLGKTVGDALNGSGSFVEFEPYGGERSFVAKAQLASVKLVGVPKAVSLAARTKDADGFDPYAVLRVARGASREEVQQAYVLLAKTYHPDRYEAAELPEEVREYLAVMARRINAAHAALETPERKRALADPVFATPGR